MTYLVFSINRSDYNHIEGKNIKMKIRLTDTREFEFGSNKFLTYCYVLHTGDDPNGGHAIAVFWHDNNWYEIDDFELTKILNFEQYYESVCSENIVMLFCKKQQQNVNLN